MRTLRSFRAINGFYATENSVWLFGEIYEIYKIYDRVGDEDKFSYERFGLGRPRFYVTSHLNFDGKEFFS